MSRVLVLFKVMMILVMLCRFWVVMIMLLNCFFVVVDLRELLLILYSWLSLMEFGLMRLGV